jgi:benzoylformate decarboxylase
MREMLLIEPWLTNVEATMLPRPGVKWAYEPVRDGARHTTS